MQNTFGYSRPGHFKAVALLMKSPLSEVSLYIHSAVVCIMAFSSFHLKNDVGIGSVV